VPADEKHDEPHGEPRPDAGDAAAAGDGR